MEKSKKKKIIKLSIFIIGIFIILIGVSYAFMSVILPGTKKQIITTGNIKLIENENAIILTNALPMYDEVGMLQTPFTFQVVNDMKTEYNYQLKLVDITTGERLDENLVKYGLTKEKEETTIQHISELQNSIIDRGKIAGHQTINYALRLWIDSDVIDEESIRNKSLSYKISIEIQQSSEDFCGYKKEDYELQIQQLEEEYSNLNQELINSRRIIADALQRTGVDGVGAENSLMDSASFVRNSLTYFSGSTQIYPSDTYQLVNGWTGTANTTLYSNRAISLTNVNKVTFNVTACGKCSSNCENRWTNTITEQIISQSGTVLYTNTQTSPGNSSCSTWTITADVSAIEGLCTFKFFRGGSFRADVSVNSVVLS